LQLTHSDTKFFQKKFPITLVCDNVSNAPNIGSILRLADAFGLEKVYFCGDHIPIGRRMKKTSRAAENVIDYEVQENISDVIQTLKENDYQLIALEITTDSIPLSSFKVQPKQSVAVVIGGENHGIQDHILAQCDTTFHIPMYGQNSSMNVTHATAIILNSITNMLV